MKGKKDNIIYCGFGVYYDTKTGDNLEKTASGDFRVLDPDLFSLLEKEFVSEGLEKQAKEKK